MALWASYKSIQKSLIYTTHSRGVRNLTPQKITPPMAAAGLLGSDLVHLRNDEMIFKTIVAVFTRSVHDLRD